MKLINLKMPKRSKKEMEKETAIGYPGDEDRYPYGLCLNLDNETVNKVDTLKTVKAGQEVTIKAEAFVKEVSVREDQKKKNHRLELQITDMAVMTKGKDDMANKEKIFNEAAK